MCLFLHAMMIHAMLHQDLEDEDPVHAAKLRPATEHEGYFVIKPRLLVVVKTTVGQKFSVE